MESELFGHERGAFTGAVAQRKGLFEQAHRGTLLIDEIGDLEPSLQPKLLRAVERAEVRRVGGDRAIRVDVRILAATRRDLDRAVQEGRFRDDLFHRLAVARIELPPLRARRGDVAELARHFWQALGGGRPDSLDPVLLAQWQRASWPGNVRELRNAVARHLALGELGDTQSVAAGDAGRAGDFIEDVVRRGLPLATGRAVVAEEYERRYIEQIVDEHGGSIGKAAEASGLARRHFQRLRARARKP
jgi:transcriptional regulator with GAF, ATPase, and Fis domain